MPTDSDRRPRAERLARVAAVATYLRVPLAELDVEADPRAALNLEGVRPRSYQAWAAVVALLAGGDRAGAEQLARDMVVVPHALVELGDEHHRRYVDRLEAVVGRMVALDFIESGVERLTKELLRTSPLAGALAEDALRVRWRGIEHAPGFAAYCLERGAWPVEHQTEKEKRRDRERRRKRASTATGSEA